jgi:hypothetical protein
MRFPPPEAGARSSFRHSLKQCNFSTPRCAVKSFCKLGDIISILSSITAFFHASAGEHRLLRHTFDRQQVAVISPDSSETWIAGGAVLASRSGRECSSVASEK